MASVQTYRTIRPGDMLTDAGMSNFTSDSRGMNVVGALVGACDPMASVYIGWDTRTIVTQMINVRSGSNAIVFGPRNIVREKFVDIHSRILTVRNMRNRTMTLQNGVYITFGYLEDDESAFHGFQFNSVWIAGERSRIN